MTAVAPPNETVRGQSADPDRGDECRVIAVEVPFVGEHHETPSSQKHADSESEHERVERPLGQTQALAASAEKQVGVQEADGVTQTVPPHVHAEDRPENRIDAMVEHQSSRRTCSRYRV
jgi:hypothetical protein